MNTAANSVPVFDRHVAPSRTAQTFLWSILRELMEHRSIVLGPVLVTGLFLIGFCISLFYLPARVRGIASLDLAHQHEVFAGHFDVAAGFIMGAAFLVAVFYSLEALSSERRDRSILFWKSMPVSDVTTVLSKATIPVVVLPLISYVLTVLTQWIMLLVSSAVLSASGLPVARLWTEVSFLRMSMLLLYHLILIHGLWYAPMFSFLLLVSAWARRVPFLWAALPIVAIAGIEKIAFNTHHFTDFLLNRISGDGSDIPFTQNDMTTGSMGPAMHLNFLHFLVNPGLWIGLALSAGFLYAAIQIRHRRSPL